MAVTPTGAPAWVRTNGHETYGGRTDKENFQAQGSVNGQTDVDVSEFCRLAADLAAVARTAPLMTFTFTCDDTTPAAPEIDDSISMLPASPTGARLGNGDVTWTFDDEYLDAYGVPGVIHLTGGEATVQGSTAGYAVVSTLDPDGDGRNERIRVQAFGSGGAALANATVTVTLSTGPA